MSVGLLPASFVTCATLGVIGVVPLAVIKPETAQLLAMCGALLLFVALLLVLLTQPCAAHESWNDPLRKCRVLFVSAVAVLTSCVSSYALGATVCAWAGERTAWSVVGSAVVVVLSMQERAAV